jgi:hypothetical protein
MTAVAQPAQSLNRKARVVLGLVLLLLFAADVVATQAVFTSRVPGANDFFSRWDGARAFWLAGLDPYSDAVTERIQIGVYGRPARPGEDQVAFVYPFYTVFTLWPIVGVPYSWAQAIWLALLEFLIVAIVLMSTDLVRWRITPVGLAALFLFALFFYPSARAILLGQHAVVVAALVIGAMLAIRARRDALAGALLAYATIKPQMIFLIIPFVLLWSIARRRWRLVLGFGASMAILVGLSFLLLPAWLAGFLRQLNVYPSYTELDSIVWIIVQHYLGLGDTVEAIISGALLIGLLVVWARTVRPAADAARDWGAFQWACGLTLIVTNIVAPRTATTHYMILYPALWLVARALVDRQPRTGRWLVAAGALVLLAGYWVLFAVTLGPNKTESPLTYLPLPIGLGLAFVVWRRVLVESGSR